MSDNDVSTCSDGILKHGDLVIRKADWRKGRKGPIGRIVGMYGQSSANRWHGPKARVQWAWNQTGGVSLSTGKGLSTLMYCDKLQAVEVRASA